jgi:GTPase SAR1 family protein
MNKNLYEFKVVVLGDKGVGKTCLVLRFIEV